jgi:hypothetical protein
MLSINAAESWNLVIQHPSEVTSKPGPLIIESLLFDTIEFENR